jgi:hypothetical protein
MTIRAETPVLSRPIHVLTGCINLIKCLVWWFRHAAGFCDFLHRKSFKNPCALCSAAAYCCGAVAPRAIAALLGRFLPRLGPLVIQAALFSFGESVSLFPGSETFVLAETGSIASKIVARTKSPANWPGDRKYWHANIGTEVDAIPAILRGISNSSQSTKEHWNQSGCDQLDITCRGHLAHTTTPPPRPQLPPGLGPLLLEWDSIPLSPCAWAGPSMSLGTTATPPRPGRARYP